MNKEIHEGEKILLGTILRVPLIIEDKATSETIKILHYGFTYQELIMNQVIIPFS